MKNKKSSIIYYRVILSLIMISYLSVYVHAQSINLSGYVKDKNTQKPVDGATVEVIDLSNNRVYTTQSYSLGNWSIDITDINKTMEKPEEFSLAQNYPNPFNPSTKIGFTIMNEGNVNLTVHNILGQLLDHKSFYLTPGGYSIDWFSKGSSGVLFYYNRNQDQ